MARAPQYVLTREQTTRLKSTLQSIQENITFIEKVTGKILIQADKDKSQPLINFCHNVLQSLRLIPIYIRNIDKMISLERNGDITAYKDKTNTLLYGLLSISEQSFTRISNDPENLGNIISELTTCEDYLTLGVNVEVTEIHIASIALTHLLHTLKEVLT